MIAFGTAPQMPEPVHHAALINPTPKTPAAPPSVPPLTADQKALLALAQVLDEQKRAEIRLTLAGAIGLGMLGTAAYLMWRRR